jgi:hypothetical protein
MPNNDLPHDAAWLRSVVEIQQLCYRYALAVDSRDVDALVRLFVPDVRVGRDLTGRDALRSWFTRSLRAVGATIHLVANHTINVGDGMTAEGVVYCREEVENRATGEWRVGMIQYRDAYQRVEDEWLFARRRVARWYETDARFRTTRDGVAADGPRPAEDLLPESFPTWSTFWDDK